MTAVVSTVGPPWCPVVPSRRVNPLNNIVYMNSSIAGRTTAPLTRCRSHSRSAAAAAPWQCRPARAVFAPGAGSTEGLAPTQFVPDGEGSNSRATTSNGQLVNGNLLPTAQPTAEPVWGAPAAASEEDWHGVRAWSLRDVDWGLASLLSLILVLSMGAYRVLTHFRVYQHARRGDQVTMVLDRRRLSSDSSSGSSSSGGGGGGGSSSSADVRQHRTQQQQQRQGQPGQQQRPERDAPGTTAAAAAAMAEDASFSPSRSRSRSSSTTTPPQPLLLPPAFLSGSGVGDVGGGIGGSSNLQRLPPPAAPPADLAGLPAAPWLANDFGQLGMLPVMMREGAALPELPAVQVDLPSKAVLQDELASLAADDTTLPSLRERAHLAMRASGAAVEASQRAAAYAAAASSAASRAAEASEQAAAAASAVQAALESAAEDAMAEAVRRMNRAVEMVADAESRAAAAAAVASAYQDVADSQAVAAAAAADLPKPLSQPASPMNAQRIADLRAVLHESLFSTRSVLADYVHGLWSALCAALYALREAVVGALSAARSALPGAGSDGSSSVGGSGGAGAGAS